MKKVKRRIVTIADIIQDEVSLMNGWYVSEQTEHKLYLKAAKRIMAMVAAWNRRRGK